MDQFSGAQPDPYGNAITLNYDADYRITTIVTDALSSPALTFVYEFDGSGDPIVPASSADSPDDYLIKEVVGPQGRYASFKFDSNHRVEGITDMAGLATSFDYGSSYMSHMTTPYGQTSFEYPADVSVSRAIVITDPEQQQERFEFTRTVDIESFLGSETAPSGTAKGPHFKDDLNTFHWDKRAMKTAVNSNGSMDYSQAVLYHWMRADTQRASSVLHSVKQPLENRDWYVYPDTFQNDLVTVGDTGNPTAIKRFVKDETGATVERTISMEYNALGRLTRSIDPVGRELEFSYAANGIDLEFIKQRIGPGVSDFGTLTSMDYDEDNNGIVDYPRLPSLIDGADGVRWDMTYNSKGQLLSAERLQPNGSGGFTSAGTTDYVYDTSGSGETYGFLLEVNGPTVNSSRPATSYTYDAYGRIHTETDADNYTLTYSYDDLDRVVQVDYPDGTFISYVFEPITDGLDLIAQFDRMGRLTQFEHDALGRVVRTIDPQGQDITFEWCGCESINSITDANGNTTTWIRDVQGRPTTKVFEDSSEINYEYEAESGLLSRITDQRGFDREFKYYKDGNLYEISYDDGGTSDPDYIDAPTVHFAHDTYFNRITTQTTEGSPDDYTYQYYGFTGNGNANRLEKLTIAKERNSSVVNNDIEYSYDALGRLYERTFKGNAETYDYDDLDRIESFSDPLGDFDYEYDGLTPRILSIQHTVSGINGIRVDLSYEHKSSGGQEREIPFLSSIVYSNPTGTVSAHAYQHNENGWIDRWQQFDGSQWKSHKYRYDQNGQLQTDRKFDGLDENSPLLGVNEYRYDRSGNRSLVKEDSEQINVAYNDLNEIDAQSSEGGVLFRGQVSEPGRVLVQRLDGSSNVIDSIEADLYGGNEFYANVELPVGTNTVRIMATDIHGESTTQDFSVPVASDGGDSFNYDAAGNLTEWAKSNGKTIHYKWDAANRLREVYVEESSVSVQVAEFEYDGAGRLVRSIEGSNANDYFWDETERLGRERFLVSSGVVSVYRRYLSQGFTHSDNGNPADNYFVIRDHLGSTRQVLDDSYSTVAEYDYDAWGKVFKLSGAIDADCLFTGHLYFGNVDSPLHLAPFRAYQPELGRWLSRDPLGEFGPDSINLYAYVGNNPINGFDPTGLFNWLDSKYDKYIDGASNFAAGFGDMFSFGLTRYAREAMGYDDVVDKCSGAYRAGEYTAVGVGLAMGGVSGLRNALAMGGKTGGLLTRLLRGGGRFFKDGRTFGTVSRQYWKAMGGASGKALHHWFKAQRAGVANAGWNLLVLPGRLNSYMNGARSTMWAENAIRYGVLSSPFLGLGAGVSYGFVRAQN